MSTAERLGAGAGTTGRTLTRDSLAAMRRKRWRSTFGIPSLAGECFRSGRISHARAGSYGSSYLAG